MNKKSEDSISLQTNSSEGYQVIARKYRPRDFSHLIGQDSMVRTLRNAFEADRLAHAFILTGIRGTGKTTTARIIAKALNCIGEDGTGGPTIEPCGLCEMCIAVSEDRHMDVLEIDAASRTGVDDVRELIEGVRYKPVSGRYKVYIIDEVHMLSRNAFNALLKTLEEPPDHVKFIFATTEIRKVPLTVLSRCQRFDLKRVDRHVLSKHFDKIAGMEKARITNAATTLIAKVSDGSVRDGQSLLDQVITNSIRNDKELDDKDVREILGLVDRNKSFDLLEQIFSGKVDNALMILNEEYENGADPLLITQDLLELIHWITKIKVSSVVLDDQSCSETEKLRGQSLAQSLSMASLSRGWQMLVKGLQELQVVPSPIRAVEMIVVRLSYLTELPTPADAIRALNEKDQGFEKTNTTDVFTEGKEKFTPSSRNSDAFNSEGFQESKEQNNPLKGSNLHNFEELVELLNSSEEQELAKELSENVKVVKFEPGKIDLTLNGAEGSDAPQRLYRFLNATMEDRWVVTLTAEESLSEAERDKRAQDKPSKPDVEKHPLLKSVMKTFPGAKIQNIREISE